MLALFVLPLMMKQLSRPELANVNSERKPVTY